MPWPKKHKNIKGIDNKVDIVIRYPFVIGYLLDNLSPIIPVIKFDANPNYVNDIAYINANSVT